MDSSNTLTTELELWAVALWVEKHHGADGPRFIAEQIGRLVLDGDETGVAMWRKVAARFELLCSANAPCRTGMTSPPMQREH